MMAKGVRDCVHDERLWEKEGAEAAEAAEAAGAVEDHTGSGHVLLQGCHPSRHHHDVDT